MSVSRHSVLLFHMANTLLLIHSFLSISLLKNIKGFISFHPNNSQRDYFKRVLREKTKEKMIDCFFWLKFLRISCSETPIGRHPIF